MVFTPPFPYRPAKVLPPLRLLRMARRNLVGIWPSTVFEKDFFGHTLLRRSLFVCNSPDTVRQVFIDDAANFHAKSPQQRHALRPLIGDGLFISDGTTWQTRRPLIAQLTHVSRLGELAPAMTAEAQATLARWQAKPAQEIDMLAEMARLAASIICRAIFGASLAQEAARDVVGGFSAFQASIEQMDLISLLGLPDFVPRLQGLRVRRAAARIHRVLDTLLAQVLAGSEPSLLRNLHDAGSLDAAALRNEAAVLFMAGHETTANTLAWAWYLLSQDQESEARFHAELDTLGGRPPAYSDMAALPFTRAVIDETLRLYPPVPIQARVAAQSREIAGRHVPAGAIVMLVPWLLHRHPRLWTDPDAFRPDRFLPGGEGAPRYAYVPFSIGPRVCTGAAFGVTESVLCLATLGQHIRPVLRPGWPVMPIARLSLRPGDSLPMRLTPR